MSLTKKDKEDIGQIVETKVSGLESKVTKEFGLLRLGMNQRFDEAKAENETAHQHILGKIEEIKQMESEDIEAVYVDLKKIKKRLPA